MASGDVVADISAADTLIDLQPAAGVFVVITWTRNFQSIPTQMHDGTLTSDSITNATPNQESLVYQRMGINNTNYLRVPAQAGTDIGSYSGVTL